MLPNDMDELRSPGTRSERTFVVRMWGESGTGSEAAWRGRLDDLQTGQRHYFGSIGELLDEIARRMQAKPR
jgi:hypothetical protein